MFVKEMALVQMKKITLLSLLVSLTSCSVQYVIPDYEPVIEVQIVTEPAYGVRDYYRYYRQESSSENCCSRTSRRSCR